jgi:dTMP kinase
MDVLTKPHPYPGKLIIVEGIDGSGKSTQLQLAMRYLQSRGLRPQFTEWNSADVVKAVTKKGKKKMTLTPLTFSLLHATDFAHRLVHNILPPLKAGMIVLADRYVYTAIARGIVRDAPRQWLYDLYGFALQPDLVFYLKIGVHDLVPRVLEAGKMNYWESGMDMNYGDDLYDSFVAYQSAIIEQFDRMADEFQFTTLDATQDVQTKQRQLRRAVGEYLRNTAYQPTLANPGNP